MNDTITMADISKAVREVTAWEDGLSRIDAAVGIKKVEKKCIE